MRMSDPNTRRPRVLLVDDYSDARDMYRAYLELCGFDVVEAVNGADALLRARDERPDIILMDLSLPVMDGWEATRRLKEDPRTADIPILVLTGQGAAESLLGQGSGPWDGFVAKPCLPEDLVRAIRVLLNAG